MLEMDSIWENLLMLAEVVVLKVYSELEVIYGLDLSLLLILDNYVGGDVLVVMENEISVLNWLCHNDVCLNLVHSVLNACEYLDLETVQGSLMLTKIL